MDRIAIAGLLERLHRAQSGAVALLALVSILILFMLTLVMYDAGKVVQSKVDVQIAGDTAAYSAGAVEARAMNQIVFANVGKRTINGIHNMYYFNFLIYFVWWLGQCAKCCCGFYCGCWSACFNCWGNAIEGSPIFEWEDYIEFLDDGNDLHKNLEDLEEFQARMIEYARWWALGEAMVRGVRNGANMVTFYPAPNGEYFDLPLAKGSNTEGCLVPLPLYDNPVTLATIAEFNANFQDLKNRSTSSPNIASKGPAEIVTPGAAILGCLMTPDDGAPYFLEADGGLDADDDDGTDLWARQNVLFTYKHEPDNGNKLRNNYEIMNDDRHQYVIENSFTAPETGVWSMASSEFYFPPSHHPNEIFSGAHGMWMFHPAWIGKLRPVMLPCDKPPVEMTTVWAESSTLGRNMALSIFGISSVPNFDAAGFSQDLQYMQRNVIPAMVGQPTDDAYCADDQHILDGVWK